MAKRTRKMGKGEGMSSSSDMNDDEEDDMEDESEKSPKRRVKKVTVVETFAKGGAVRGSASKYAFPGVTGMAQPQGRASDVRGRKFSGTY